MYCGTACHVGHGADMPIVWRMACAALQMHGIETTPKLTCSVDSLLMDWGTCTGCGCHQDEGGLHDQPGAGRPEAAQLQRVLPLVRQGAQVRLCSACLHKPFPQSRRSCNQLSRSYFLAGWYGASHVNFLISEMDRAGPCVNNCSQHSMAYGG